MKKLLTILTAASLGGLALVARLGVAPPAAIAAGSCRGERVAAVVDPSALATGSAVAAADGNALTVLRGGLVDRLSAPDHITGVLRHVSVTAGVGTTYVRDRDGDDVVVAETRGGVHRFRAGGEALNPSFSSAGDLVWAQRGGLRFVAAGSDMVRTIEGPIDHGIAFSPVFREDGTIVVGIVSPSADAAPEDETLSNLWRYDAVSDGWRRLTDFSSGADRWTVVRTPFLASDGSVEFVRVHGRASEDQAPAYELWRLHGASATMLRALSGEMYLAGFDGSVRLWNVREGSTGAWAIDREEVDGSLHQVGCGAVEVDPLDRPDPDRRSSTRSARRQAATTPSSEPGVDQILVGDFPSSDAADQTAGRIEAATGSSATVVDSTQAPAVVRPGVWAVVVPIATDDPEGDLARFRQAFPDLADSSWIVSI